MKITVAKLKEMIREELEQHISEIEEIEEEVEEVEEEKELSLEELEAVIREEMTAVLNEKEKSVFHACAAHVGLKESGEEGTPINHTLLEDGSVTHYTVEFEDRIVEGIPADALNVLEERVHEHPSKRDDDEDVDESKPRVKYETQQ